jgi:hypothetical protein
VNFSNEKKESDRKKHQKTSPTKSDSSFFNESGSSEPQNSASATQWFVNGDTQAVLTAYNSGNPTSSTTSMRYVTGLPNPLPRYDTS